MDGAGRGFVRRESRFELIKKLHKAAEEGTGVGDELTCFD